MEAAEIQIVSNQQGEATAVIVPIQLWREIESERETAYLSKSEAIKRRLPDAEPREGGVPLEATESREDAIDRIRGKYAFVNTSVEEFLARKHEDTAREDKG